MLGILCYGVINSLLKGLFRGLFFMGRKGVRPLRAKGKEKGEHEMLKICSSMDFQVEPQGFFIFVDTKRKYFQ
ncbi:MAG TPA: hypothetical protein DEA52_01805 [Clostridiaceae bacterium]|nr:hypothetical protein [Clostridiaceae bacterium]